MLSDHPRILPEDILDFDLSARSRDWQLGFYETPEQIAPADRTAGCRTLKVAENVRYACICQAVSSNASDPERCMSDPALKVSPASLRRHRVQV